MSDELNWNLLPDEPVKFFQLPSKCDQRTLKRAYGKLIRQFKPEKHPEQFKKIREAYERVTQMIEYGYWDDDNDDETTTLEYGDLSDIEPDKESLSTDGDPFVMPEIIVTSFDGTKEPPQHLSFDSDEETNGETETSESDSDSDETPIFRNPFFPDDGSNAETLVDPLWNQRLETENPDSLYDELTAKTPKEPEDYIRLAFLSDAILDSPESNLPEEGQPSQFENWLLKGLKETPKSPMLFSIFSEYLSQLPANRFSNNTQRIQFLKNVAKTIKDHRFFGATYSIWIDMLRTAPIEEFQEAVDDCGAILFDPNEGDKLFFYIRLLNPIEWKISEVRRARKKDGKNPYLKEVVLWFKSKREYLETHYDQIPFYDLDQVFDELTLIRKYYRFLDDFLNQDNPALRLKFHKMLRDYILHPPAVAQHKLYQFQNSILKNKQKILKGFTSSFNLESREEVFYDIWSWMIADCPGMGIEADYEPQKLRASSAQFLKLCNGVKHIQPTSSKINITRLKKLILPAFVFVPILIGLWLFGQSSSELEAGNIIGGTVIAIIFSSLVGYYLQELANKSKKKQTPKEIQHGLSQYQKHLQPLWIDFIANNHWHFNAVIEVTKEQKMLYWQNANTKLFFKYGLKDTGALIIALARRSIP